MDFNQKITILGAGISGLSAAINLAAKGFKVEVLEKRSNIGSKYKGDFQGLENWTHTEDVLKFLHKINIPIEFDYEPFKKCYYFDDKLRRFPIKSNRVGFYLIRRGPMKGSLDKCLENSAINKGVKIVYNYNTKNDKIDIIANGKSNPFLKAIGINFETDLPKTAYAIFDNELSPKGYSYLVSIKGKATLAIVTKFKEKKLDDKLDKAIYKFNQISHFQITNPVKFAGVGTSYQDYCKPIPHIGEAGGLQDAMWGFGLRMAFQSGYLAALSIYKKKDYHNLIKKHVIPFCESSIINRIIYDKIVSKNYRFFLSLISNSNDPVEFSRKLYSQSRTKQLILPLLKYFMKS